MNFDNLLNNKSKDIKSNILDDVSKSMQVNDKSYIQFLKSTNGGYFFNNSLLIFAYSDIKNQVDIHNMNSVFNENYGHLVKGLYFFGMDIFGNPFAFNDDNVVFFNLESGEKEIIAKNFDNWIKELDDDIDYYTGKSLADKLNDYQNNELSKGKRLCPKYPFILGGEYNMNNLVLKDYLENISFNADIAKQVYSLPEGSQIKIKIK